MSQKKSESLVTDFTSGSVSRQLIVFSAPLLLSNLLQVVYNMVDMAVVGQAVGKLGLSAVSVGGDVSQFLTFLAIGFSGAGQVIISQYIGAGRQKEVGRFVGTMFHFLILCALILSAVCLFFRQPILRLMNTPDEAWAQAMDYATVCMVGLVFIYGYNLASAVLRGMGDSKHPFLFISIAAGLNIVLDLILVMGFGMGAFGAAVATVISQAVSFLCCMFFLWRSRDRLGFQIHMRDFLRMDLPMLRSLVALGVPMAVKNGAVQFSKLFVNSWINGFGVEVSAVAGIANKLNNISILVSSAVNTAGASMVGQNIGAEKYDRVPKVMRTAFLITLTMSAAMSVALLVFPEQIFGIFTNEADVMSVAMEYLPVSVLIFFGSACRAPMNAFINGSGNYKINFLCAILDGLILRVGLALLLGVGAGLGYVGFWLGDALAGYTPLWMGFIYYATGRWKTRKYVLKVK